MADAGGTPPGWYADPQGRHQHRWWDGATWTDQVADDGVTTVDPVDPVDGVPSDDGPNRYLSDEAVADTAAARRFPVGVVAGLAVLVAAAAAAIVLVVGALGGDDSGSSGDQEATDDAPAADEGTFSGAVTADEPVVLAPVTLEAGDALRVVVEPDGLDAVVQLAVEEAALTDGFEQLLAPGGDPGAVDERLQRQVDILETNTGSNDVDGEVVDETGPLVVGTDRGGTDDPEGLQFVAPTAGTYTIVVSGYAGSEGEVTGRYEVEAGSGEAPDPEAIDYLAYLGRYQEHTDFLCEEDFFGADPVDVANYGPTVCDPSTLSGVVDGSLNGDFTNDFGGGEGLEPEFSDDFSDDFSTDFSDDFSFDLPDPFGELGEPQDPASFIPDYGSEPEFDALADGCFAGDLADCDQLYAITPIDDSTNSYEGYGATCGGRLEQEAPGTCSVRGDG